MTGDGTSERNRNEICLRSVVGSLGSRIYVFELAYVIGMNLRGNDSEKNVRALAGYPTTEYFKRETDPWIKKKNFL